jgi:hypothetical protein
LFDRFRGSYRPLDDRLMGVSPTPQSAATECSAASAAA